VAPKWVIWYIQQQKTLRIARERFYSRFKIADDSYPRSYRLSQTSDGQQDFFLVTGLKNIKDSETARGNKACVSFSII